MKLFVVDMMSNFSYVIRQWNYLSDKTKTMEIIELAARQQQQV